jgi:hypothetical protein
MAVIFDLIRISVLVRIFEIDHEPHVRSGDHHATIVLVARGRGLNLRIEGHVSSRGLGWNTDVEGKPRNAVAIPAIFDPASPAIARNLVWIVDLALIDRRRLITSQKTSVVLRRWRCPGDRSATI